MEASIPAAHRETLASEAPTVLAPLPSDDRLIPAAELPRFIGLAAQTLARLRCEGNGPPFVKIGRLIYYRASDVRDWLAQRRYSNTIYTGQIFSIINNLGVPNDRLRVHFVPFPGTK